MTVLDATTLSDQYTLSAVIRAFLEFFFTSAERELYAPWIDLATVLATFFLVFAFIRWLFGPWFSRRSAKK